MATSTTGDRPATSPACIVCGTSRFTKVLTSFPLGYPGRGHDYEQCAECGVLREDPALYDGLAFDFEADVADLSDADKQSFRDQFGEVIEVVTDAGEPYEKFDYVDTNDMVDDLAARVLDRLPPAGDTPIRLLDVGCANGFLLRRLQERRSDLDVIGIDPSPVSHQQATQLGTTTHVGTLQTVPAADLGWFDVVIAVGNLMLHPDPADSLRRMHAVMKPGATLIIDVKNQATTTRELARILARTPLASVGPVRSYITRNYENLRWSFTSDHIVSIVKAAGFDPTEVNALPPRALAYANAHKGSNGIAGVVWRAFDRVDQLRGERAWTEVVGTRR